MAATRAKSQDNSPKKLDSAFGWCCHCAIFLHGVFSRDVVLKEKAFWILLGQGIPFPCILKWKTVNIWINHHFCNYPLPSLWRKSEFGWVCSTQVLLCCLMNPCFCARSGCSSSALLCACTHWCVRCSPSKGTPRWELLPSWDACLGVRLVLPSSHSGPCFSMEDAINDAKLQPRRPQQAVWRHSCGC